MRDTTHDPLTILWRSTKHFHLRFRDTMPTVSEAINPLREEVQEVIDAVIWETPERAAEEAADTVVTLISLLLARGITRDEFENALERVAAKNDSKTLETHFVREDGKIARRESVA